MFDNLWCEKYRPRSVDMLILSAESKRVVDKYTTDKEVPNLLLLGSPGVGKTTLSKIIVNDILKCQYLYINASDESGIDTIRSKVTQFAQTRSIDGCIKVIILDESDGISQEGQRALRNTMEQYSGFTRFILTGNYKHRIIPAVQSRCQTLDLTPPLEDVVQRITEILKAENIEVADSQRSILTTFIKNKYPDIRKIINEIQKSCINGKLHIADTQKSEVLVKQLFALLSNGHVLKLRKFIIQNEESFNSDYPALLKMIFEHIDGAAVDEKKKKMYLVIVAEALYRCAFVADQEINCYSCLIQMSSVN